MDKEIKTKRGRGMEGGSDREREEGSQKEASGPQEMEPPLTTPTGVAYPGGCSHLVLS